jgi:hypothetical protein
MTSEERELLNQVIELTEENNELAKENNKLLRGMRRSARIASVLRIIYWVIIIGSAFGAYYAIQPFFNSFVDSYNGMKDNLDTVKNITTKLPSLPTWLGGKQ